MASQRLTPYHEWRFEMQGRYLRRALRYAKHNVAEAARLAGINRTQFYKLLADHHINVGAMRTKASRRGAHRGNWSSLDGLGGKG